MTKFRKYLYGITLSVLLLIAVAPRIYGLAAGGINWMATPFLWEIGPNGTLLIDDGGLLDINGVIDFEGATVEGVVTFGSTLEVPFLISADGASIDGTLDATTIDVDNFLIDSTEVTASAPELNILDGITGTDFQELNQLDGITGLDSTELNWLDGVTGLDSTEVNWLNGVTGLDSTEVNWLDGVTGLDSTEVNWLDGVTGLDSTEVNWLNGVTGLDSTEVNWLNGVTGLDSTEVNWLDGVTGLDSTEVNWLDGVTGLDSTEVNWLDGVTGLDSTEVNFLNGVTGVDSTNINNIGGLTVDLGALTSSTSELNQLDGSTAVVGDFNKLHAVTVSAAELNQIVHNEAQNGFMTLDLTGTCADGETLTITFPAGGTVYTLELDNGTTCEGSPTICVDIGAATASASDCSDDFVTAINGASMATNLDAVKATDMVHMLNRVADQGFTATETGGNMELSNASSDGNRPGVKHQLRHISLTINSNMVTQMTGAGGEAIIMGMNLTAPDFISCEAHDSSGDLVTISNISFNFKQVNGNNYMIVISDGGGGADLSDTNIVSCLILDDE